MTSNELKYWLQGNLRIIISIFIVVAIAMGIYNYSTRSEDQRMNTIQESQSISPCESFGNSINLEAVPLRCKVYWEEQTSIR